MIADLDILPTPQEFYLIAVLMDDHTLATLMVFAAPGELDRWIDTALAIAGSLQVNLPQLQAYEGL